MSVRLQDGIVATYVFAHVNIWFSKSEKSGWAFRDCATELGYWLPGWDNKRVEIMCVDCVIIMHLIQELATGQY